MSTVYVVCRCYDYEGCALEGAFSTQELADAYVASKKDPDVSWSSTTYEVSEEEVDRLAVPLASEGEP
jgi:hypothetical protein